MCARQRWLQRPATARPRERRHRAYACFAGHSERTTKRAATLPLPLPGVLDTAQPGESPFCNTLCACAKLKNQPPGEKAETGNEATLPGQHSRQRDTAQERPASDGSSDQSWSSSLVFVILQPQASSSPLSQVSRECHELPSSPRSL